MLHDPEASPAGGEERKTREVRHVWFPQLGFSDARIFTPSFDEVTRALPAYTWLIDLGPVRVSPTTAPVASASAAPKPVAHKPGAAPADSAANGPVQPPPVQFELNGRTVDIQAYTRFLRQLEASPWITDVLPVSAQTVVEKERPVTAFTIRATYHQADSAYIRTVPLSQSVR